MSLFNNNDDASTIKLEHDVLIIQQDIIEIVAEVKKHSDQLNERFVAAESQNNRIIELHDAIVKLEAVVDTLTKTTNINIANLMGTKGNATVNQDIHDEEEK